MTESETGLMRNGVRSTTHQACTTYRDRPDIALPGIDPVILRNPTLLIQMTSTRDDVNVEIFLDEDFKARLC